MVKQKFIHTLIAMVHTIQRLSVFERCEALFWTHRTSTPHRSETNGIAERAVRRIKEGTSAVSLQSGLDEKWRLILWTATAICQTFKISWQMGKHLTKDDSEYHLKDRSFRLVQWLNISNFC